MEPSISLPIEDIHDLVKLFTAFFFVQFFEYLVVHLSDIREHSIQSKHLPVVSKISHIPLQRVQTYTVAHDLWCRHSAVTRPFLLHSIDVNRFVHVFQCLFVLVHISDVSFDQLLDYVVLPVEFYHCLRKLQSDICLVGVEPQRQ